MSKKKNLTTLYKLFSTIIVVGIGIALSTKEITGISYSLNIDEIYTVLFSRASLFSQITGIRYDPANPPFYYLLTKIWTSFSGSSESALRTPPIIFSLLSFTAVALYSRKIFKNSVWITVCLLLASSHLLYALSRLARTYTLILLLSILTFPVLYRFLRETKRQYLWGGMAFILCIIGMYSHYCFIPFYAFCLITLSIQFKNNFFILKKLGIFTFLLGYFYFPWAWIFIRNQVWPRASWQPFVKYYSSRWVGLEGWFDAISNGILPYALPDMYRLACTILFFFLINAIFYITYSQNHGSSFKKTILLFTLISLNTILFTPLHNIYDLPKYSMYIIPMLILSIGIFLNSIKSRVTSIGIMLTLLIFSFASFIRIPRNNPDGDWKALAQYLYQKKLQSAAILFQPCFLGFAFNYYYHGTLPMYCFLENPDNKMYIPIWQPKDTDVIYFVTLQHDGNDRTLDNSYSSFISRYTKSTQTFSDIVLETYTNN